MKQRIIFITLGIIGYICAAQTSQSSDSPQPAFSISLSPPVSPVSAASPIEIKITVQNISGRDISWWAEYGDTAYKAFHFSLKKDDHEVETSFFHRKITGKQRQGDPAEVDFGSGSSVVASLAAGKSIVQVIDLQRLYQITEPGSYTLEVSRYDDESSTTVRSNKLTLAIDREPAQDAIIITSVFRAGAPL